jgi:hypothetical protein
MARNLYLAPTELASAYNEKFAVWHAIPVGDGTMELISALFSTDRAQDAWESLPGITVIGNELSQAQIDADAATILADFAVTPDMTPGDVRKLIRTTYPHPLF